MKEFLETHKLEYLQQAITYGKEHPYKNSEYKGKIPEIIEIVKANKYNNPGTGVVTLDSDKHNVVYLFDHSADKELADNLNKGDGAGIRKAYNIENLSENDIREFARNISSYYRNSEGTIRSRLQKLGISSEHLPGIDIDAAIQGGIRDNVEMVDKTGESVRQTFKDRGSINSRKNQGVLPFMTPQGEIYGFVDKEGNIYIDETVISSEHLIHEYTHLWDRVVQQRNPRLWQRGVELMKQTPLWNETLNDANYGRKWQSMNLTQERLDNLIASEVHARFTGRTRKTISTSRNKKRRKENCATENSTYLRSDFGARDLRLRHTGEKGIR